MIVQKSYGTILLFLLFIEAALSAAPVLKADFNTKGDLSALLYGKALPAVFANRNQRHQTPEDSGFTGRAVLFCRDNLHDFHDLVPGLDRPLSTIVYRGLHGLPTKQGNVEIFIKPYFNDITLAGKTPHNYIFRLYRSSDRKQTLTVFLVGHRQITVQFDFSNGKKSYLYYTLKKREPKIWRRLNIRWDKCLQQLYVDGHIAIEKNIDGALFEADRLEIGGKDGGYLLFQGLIDDISIGTEIPIGLKTVNLREQAALIRKNEGDPLKFGKISDDRIMYDPAQWKGFGGISAVKNGSNLRLVWSGADFRHRTIYGPPVKVAPGSVIRGDLSFRKVKWDFAVYAPACVAFFDSKGRPLRQNPGYDGSPGEGIRFDESNIKGYFPMHLMEFTEQAGLRSEIRYFNYWKVPENAVAMRAGWTFAYNPCSVEIAKLEFRTVDPVLRPWITQPEKVPLKANISRGTTDAELEKNIASRKRAVAEVRKEGDRVELYIDGKRTLPAFMHNTPYPVKNVPWYSNTFAQLGFKISTVWVSLGRSPVDSHLPFVLKEDGTIDIAPWREAVREIVRQAPDGYVMLALNVFPTMRWLEENPDELMKNGKGENFIFGYPHYPIGKGAAERLPPGNFSWYPSMFSKKYMEYICNALRKALLEFEKTPESKAVIGAYLVGGDDAQFRLPNIAFTPDLSPCALNGFRDFLRQKYGNDVNLRREWNDPDASIENVSLPLQKELWVADRAYYSMGGHSSWLSDYKTSYALSDRRFKTAIRKAAKSAVPRMIIGGYDCAYGMTGSWGHTGLHFAEGIEDAADFYIWIPSYGRDRDNGDLPLKPYQFTGSLALHGKLGILEMDIRNPNIPNLYFGHYKSRNWQETHNYRTFATALNRLAASAIALGGGFHCYNLQPHWFLSDKAQDAWRNAFRIAEQRRGEGFSEEQIAVFIDENSNLYSNLHPHWVPSFFNFKGQVVAAVQRAGFKHNYYLLRDALHPDFKAPLMLLFADAGTMTPEEIVKIRERHGNSGRVIVWHGCPGFLACGDYETLSKSLGFDVSPLQGNRQQTPLVAANDTDPVMKGISGFFMQEPNFLPFVFSPSWRIGKDGSTILAKYYGTDIPGMAVKRYQDHTEIFIGQPGSVSPQLIRNAGAEAKMHPLLESDDLFIYGGSLMTVCGSLGRGIRKIRIPDGIREVVPLTPHKVLHNDGKNFEVDISDADVAVFLLK